MWIIDNLLPLAAHLSTLEQAISDLGFPRFLRMSNILQFILDTDHCWLDANKDWLEQYPDVRHAICDKQSPLWTQPSTPERALPEDLFANLSVDNNKVGSSGKGWPTALKRLQELRDCPAALQDAKQLHIYIFVHSSQYSDHIIKENPLPPPKVPELFVDVLENMPNLERLDWGVTSESSHVFAKAFAEADVKLPSVKFLQPSAYSDWLVPRCPNLEVVQAGSFFHHASWNDGSRDPTREDVNAWFALIEATKGLPIKEWRLHAWWTLELLEKILDATPDIVTLQMHGPLERGYSGEDKSDTLQNFLATLAHFPKLEVLDLPRSSDLGLGFDGGPGCGNAYFGSGGRAYGRTVTQRGAETTEIAAKMVAEALPGLTKFSIGSNSPSYTFNEDGTREMVWPWTGRMNAYTYDVWPETTEVEYE